MSDNAPDAVFVTVVDDVVTTLVVEPLRSLIVTVDPWIAVIVPPAPGPSPRAPPG